MQYGKGEGEKQKVETKDGQSDDLDTIVAGLIGDAVEYVDGELSPARAKAVKYYQGQPFGDERAGRSQVVLTEVRDAIDSVIPSLLRVFFGPDHTVEFEPVSQEDVEHSLQATDYARYVFERDNDGMMIAYSVLKDALRGKIGALKWGWEDAEPKAFKFEQITEEQLVDLQSNAEFEITKVEQHEGEPVFNVEGTHTAKDGRVWIEAMPAEELLFTPNVRPGLKGTFVGHRTEKTRSELRGMGVSEADLEEHGGRDDRLKDNEERTARRATYTGSDASYTEEERAGKANDTVTYVEGYFRLDINGSGVALRQICTIGPKFHIVKNEPADYIRMAAWCPNPEPHTISGLSDADNTMDMQLIKSKLFRASMDSLGFAVFPRVAYQEGMVAVEDVLNDEIGAPIRTRAMPSNVMQEFTRTWIGKEALSALDYCDAIIEKRTGRDKGAMGIDADALQSTNKIGVEAAVQSSQERIEFKARLFAEMILKPLFKGILRELVSHQPRAKMIRLRNKFVEIDPSTWNVDMDVLVKVALGSELKEKKLEVLAALKATQESILTQLGPQNPLVTLRQYYNTLKAGLELSGIRDVQNYITEVDPNWQPPAPPAPQKTPEEVLAETQLQIEQMKTQRELAIKEAELALKEQETAQNHDREMLKMAQELEIAKLKLEMEYNTKIEMARLDAEIKRSAAVLDGEIAAAKLTHVAEMSNREDDREERRMGHEQSLEERRQAHDEHITERQQETSERQASETSE